MDSDLLKQLIPQIPKLAGRAFWHALGRTPTSSQWDLRTELTVQILRGFMGPRSPAAPIGKIQEASVKDPGVKGPVWIAKASIKAPEPGDENLTDAVCRAIDELKPADSGELNYTRPGLVDINVEWTGYRAGAGNEDPIPNISEQEKYQKLMTEPTRKSDTTILYFHGGAYYLCSPVLYRVLSGRLARRMGGRVCSVEYRLAPQGAFPAQLLDGLMVYLGLLYPPPGSLHEAISAKSIVFAGDSAGGNLSASLLQFLLQLHRTSSNPTLRFHGKEVSVPLPAGVAPNSGWFDISRCMPSLLENLDFDYIPKPSDDGVFTFPHDNVWPSTPPRGDLFTDLSLIDHPLVSPLSAANWENSPPIWLCVGKECLKDEIQSVAARMMSQGVTLQYEDYEAMPHVFALVLEWLPNAEWCIRNWADFAKRCVEEPQNLKAKGTFIRTKTGKEVSVDVAGLSRYSHEEVRAMMKESKERKMVAFKKELAKGQKASL